MPKSEPPKGFRRVLRIARRTILVLLGIAILALGIGLIVVHTDWGRNKVRGVIESSLASSFAGGAKVRSLEGSILGDFTIEGIELFDAKGKPAITIGTLHANVALWKLGHKVAEFEKLEIEDLTISIGNAPLTKPSEAPSGEPTAWSVKLPEIKITRGKFEMRDGKEPLTIEGIAITGGVAIPAGGAISATNLEVAGTWREKKLPIVITAGVELDSGVAIPGARIKVGDLVLAATGLVIDTQQPAGTIRITGSPESIAAVAPQIELPAGVDIELVARPSGRAADITLSGTLGDAAIHGAIHGDLAKRTASGWIGAGKVNLHRLLRSSGNRPLANVKGDLALAVTADTTGIRGILGVHGAVGDLPASDSTIVVNATWKAAALTVLATGEGDSRIALDAHATRAGKTITIDRARVVASAKQLAPPTADRVAVGAQQLIVDARLVKPGTVSPVMDLAFDGSVRGARVSYDDVVVAGFDTSFTGSLREKLYVQSTTRVRGASRAGLALGSGTIAANLLPDGRIFARADLKPALVAVRVVASGYITTGDTITIALGDHAITPVVGAPWTGKGGRITIDPAGDVRVRDLVTTNGPGRAKIDASIIAGTLEASVDALGLPVSAIDPAYRGTVSGKLSFKRRGQRWDGGGTLVAEGLVIDPTAPVFEGDVKLAVAGRMVTVDGHAKSADIGGVGFQLEVEGPRDLTDFTAWKRLERTAIRTAVITADKVVLDAVSSTGGRVDGKLRIGGTAVEGAVEVKGVVTSLGTAEGTVTFSPLGKDLFASWNALLSDVGEASVGLRVQFPQYPFDPAAWKLLGRGVVQSLTASFDDIAIDPVKLAKLGITAPYSGRADLNIAIGSAANGATIDVDLRSIEGGTLVKPIDVHVEATTDGTGTVASACVARAKDPGGDACKRGGLGSIASATKLLEIKDVKVPITFSSWLIDPKAALGASLEATIAIPSQSAPAYLAVIGRGGFEPDRGTIEGTIKIAGTIAKPIGKGTLTMKSLQLISQVEGRTIPELKELKVTGSWDGTLASIDITATESNNGNLTIKADGRPSRLSEARGSFEATKLDLAPLAAFLPGELAASQGELNGYIAVASFDFATARANGLMALTKADVPLDPMIGTLRNGELTLIATKAKSFSLTAKGLLNACRNPENPKCKQNIVLEASSPADLSSLTATLTATKVTTIGEIEPIIDAKAKVALTRSGRLWTGDIYITKTKNDSTGELRVTVPVSTGDDLLDFENPDDIYFTDKPPPKQIRLGEAKIPNKVWLDARLHIASTEIIVLEYGVVASVVARQPLQLRVGDAIGLDGAISVEYGTASDIFGRDYEIEQNDIVRFDGTIDPFIDLKLSHRFPELTLGVEVTGQLSDPKFPPAPRFTADQGNYTEDQLAGFFLGADPGGGAQAGDVARGAGSSLVSQAIAKRLKNVLPERLRVLDYIGCETTSSNNGGSCSAGKRFAKGRFYVSLKHRLAPLPNENPEELLAQYYLSTEWFIEGSGGTGSIIGTDLLWRRRW